MGVVYALYDKTENKIYHADKINHDKGWSDFIIKQNPDHKFIKTEDCKPEYDEIMENNPNDVDLLDPKDNKGCAIYQRWKEG